MDGAKKGVTREPLLTTVVGSYPQPDWLVNRLALAGGVPRIRDSGIWRIPEEYLQDAQDDATVVAIRDMERAGLDIISDGEIRRESYSNRFATALDGIDLEHPGQVISARGQATPVPRVVGPVRRVRPVQVRDVEFLRANTRCKIKATVPGPFTLAQQVQNDYYPDRESLAMDYAACVNQEVQALFNAGADVVQLDEPWLRNNPAEAREFAVKAIDRALENATGVTALHLCFGYAAVVSEKPGAYSFLTELERSSVQQISIGAAQPKLDLSVLREMPSKTIILGVLDLADPEVETPEMVAAKIQEALRFVAPERLQVAPDCGMKYLQRQTALAKLQALTAGAGIVKKSLGLTE